MAPGASPRTSASADEVEAALAPAELELLRERRFDPPASPRAWAFSDGMAGLAFSGGGIRSATFNLGFLQALLRCRLFRRFHFLSTVSGGGYLGSLVSAHAGSRPDGKGGFPYAVDAAELDADLLKHLRENCRYLTPSNGSRFADLLALGVPLVRGFVAHVLMAALFFGVLAVPFLIRGPERFPGFGDLAPHLPAAIGITAGALVLLSLLTLFWEPVVKGPLHGALNGVLAVGLGLLVLEAAALAHHALTGTPWAEFRHWIAGALGAAGAGGAYVALRGAADAFDSWSRWRRVLLRIAPWLLFVGAGYALLWFIRTGLFRLLGGPAPAHPAALAAWYEGLVWTLESARWWTQLSLFFLVLGHALFSFATGSRDPARARGRRLQIGLYGIAIAVVTVPVLFPHTGETVVAWTGLGCLAAGLVRSVVRELRHRAPVLELLVLAPVLLALARSVYWSCVHVHPDGRDHAYWHLLLLLIQAGTVFCLFFNLNATSLHGFYRDRLVRLFLSDPRTGGRLPPGDLSLDKLAGNAKAGLPLHLVCCAVNLPSCDDRRVAERRVDSFVVSGAAVGSASLGPGGFVRPDAFRRAGEPVTLPAAMAVSGAAVSPHFGAGVPAPVSALMTVLNIRLGQWWPNPRYLHEKPLPSLLAFPFWPVSFVKEMFSAFDPRDLRCLVSDGGHFENLGLYELVRRRCRYIVVSDAGSDPERRFRDLGNAVRRCRADFGADIRLDTELLRPDPANGVSGRHVALGTVRYRDGATGVLIYVKSSLTGDEPPDVLQYRRDHPAFPHESTADQDFDEAQFESYRRLGEHVGEEVFGRKPAAGDLLEFFNGVRDRWRTPAADGGARFVELCRDFAGLEGSDFVQTANLLDAQQVPEIFPGEPPAGDPHAAFHHAVRQLQLVENFWIALRLDEPDNRNHPDNRGAMNLFRRWARSDFLRSVYPVIRSLYGQEFQRFCEDQLRFPGNGDCLRTPDAPILTPDAWKRCEEVLAHHAILGVVRTALPSLEGRARLHTVELVHRGGSTPVGIAIVTNGERRPAPQPPRAELFAFMIDNRYFYSGVAERLLEGIRAAHPETEFVMLPLAKGAGVDDEEWDGRVRYFQQLGFAAARAEPRSLDKDTCDGYVARTWSLPPRPVPTSPLKLPYLHWIPRAPIS